MDVQIEEMSSRVDVVDSASLLSPEIMERLVQEILRRMKEAESHAGRVQEERRLTVPPSHREGV